MKFEGINDPIKIDQVPSFINIDNEFSELQKEISDIEKDYTIYLTYRPYEDNYFAHSRKNTMFVSFNKWEHYTSLPLENGLFYFISDVIALKLDKSKRHDSIIGCIYDMLWDKTGIDTGMKEGYICENCLTRINENVNFSKKSKNIIKDLIEILNVLSNASKWGKSIFELNKNQSLFRLNWSSFEDEVAQLYRQLGASVKQNINMAGFQIDIYLEEETPSKQKLRTVVECKFHKNKIGNRYVNDFFRIVNTLKDSGLVDKGIIISSSGFSKDANLVSKGTSIELINFKDLHQKINFNASTKNLQELKATKTKIDKKIQFKQRRDKSPEIFVIMPFTPDLDDVYYLGIHEIAKTLNRTCERVDEIEFAGSILDEIYNSIYHSRIIVAEVSNQNANVYYELGYAHALNKPVILITKDIYSTPFDLNGFNHIIYKNIVDLRKKLEKRLEAIVVCN